MVMYRVAASELEQPRHAATFSGGNRTPPPGAGRRALIPIWKRAVDIAFCLVALPALGTATLLIAALTSITSRGPIFFRQERVGFRGQRFKLYKFRTMHVSADVTSHQAHFSELVRSNTPMQKMDAKGDARLIAGGRWLRAAGLDELPQIINVLRGDMSLVGPRPCIPYEYEQYSAEQRERFACAPGLTGLWQVSGKSRTNFEEMVRLDVSYSRRQSPLLDLGIMIMTIPAVCGQIVAVGWARRPTLALAASKPVSMAPASQVNDDEAASRLNVDTDTRR